MHHSVSARSTGGNATIHPSHTYDHDDSTSSDHFHSPVTSPRPTMATSVLPPIKAGSIRAAHRSHTTQHSTLLHANRKRKASRHESHVTPHSNSSHPHSSHQCRLAPNQSARTFPALDSAPSSSSSKPTTNSKRSISKIAISSHLTTCSTPVLSRVFSSATSLLSFLTSADSCSPYYFAASQLFTKDHSASYRQFLITTVVAVTGQSSRDSDSLRDGSGSGLMRSSSNESGLRSGCEHSANSTPDSIQSVIFQVISSSLSSSASSSSSLSSSSLVPWSVSPSVLTFGYRLISDRSASILYPHPDIENYDTNTLCSHLIQSKEWHSLSVHIGPNCLKWLLSKCCIFELVGETERDCYLQICGPPIIGLVRETQGDKWKKVKGKKERAGSKPDQMNSVQLVRTSSAPNVKLPPSPASAPIISTNSNNSDSTPTKSSVHPLSRAQSASASSPAVSRDTSTANLTKSHLPPTLSSHLISRSSLFYTMPARMTIGLPSSHILNQLLPSNRAAKILIESIFQSNKKQKERDEKLNKQWTKEKNLMMYRQQNSLQRSTSAGKQAPLPVTTSTSGFSTPIRGSSLAAAASAASASRMSGSGIPRHHSGSTSASSHHTPLPLSKRSYSAAAATSAGSRAASPTRVGQGEKGGEWGGRVPMSRLPARLLPLIPIVRRLIRAHRHMQYRKIWHQCCAVEVKGEEATTTVRSTKKEEAAKVAASTAPNMLPTGLVEGTVKSAESTSKRRRLDLDHIPASDQAASTAVFVPAATFAPSPVDEVFPVSEPSSPASTFSISTIDLFQELQPTQQQIPMPIHIPVGTQAQTKPFVEVEDEPFSPLTDCSDDDTVYTHTSTPSPSPPPPLPLLPDPSALCTRTNLSHSQLSALPLSTLLSLDCPIPSVCQFLHTILSMLLPPQLFGSHHNFSVLLSGVNRFVRLRRFETMSVGELRKEMRVTEIRWLWRVDKDGDKNQRKERKKRKEEKKVKEGGEDAERASSTHAAAMVPAAKKRKRKSSGKSSQSLLPPHLPCVSPPIFPPAHEVNGKDEVQDRSSEVLRQQLVDVTVSSPVVPLPQAAMCDSSNKRNREYSNKRKQKGNARGLSRSRGKKKPKRQHTATNTATSSNAALPLHIPIINSSTTSSSTISNPISAPVIAPLAQLGRRARKRARTLQHSSTSTTTNPISLDTVPNAVSFPFVLPLVLPPPIMKRKQPSHTPSRPKVGHLAHEKQVQLLSYLLRWLFSCYIIPLLRTCFFCTDSEQSKNRLCYYPRPIWNIIIHKSMYTLTNNIPTNTHTTHSASPSPSSSFPSSSFPIQEAQFHKLTKSQVSELLHPSSSSMRRVGVGHLRIRPRKNGVRPIVNMARESWFDTKPAQKWKAMQSPQRHKGRVSRSSSAIRGSVISPVRQLSCSTSMNGISSSLHRFLPINHVMRPCFDIIRYETKRRDGILGSSVFGLNDVYMRYFQFVQVWKRRTQYQSSLLNNRPSRPSPLYVVSVDVRKCFDNLNRVEVLKLLTSLLSEPCYGLQRYSLVWNQLGQIRAKYNRLVYPATALPLFHTFATNAASSSSYSSSSSPIPSLHSSILTDHVTRSFLDTTQLVQLLREHLFMNIVKLHQDYYQQVKGIPQGSVLSAILCCLYLGEIEKKFIQPVLEGRKSAEEEKERKMKSGEEKSGGETGADRGAVKLSPVHLLLRQMDDFLLFTSDRSAAERYIQLMQRGFPHEGLQINAEKTRTNFITPLLNTTTETARTQPTSKTRTSSNSNHHPPPPYQKASSASSSTHPSTTTPPTTTTFPFSSRFLPWNGFLIDTHTLSLRCDYSRSLSSPIRDSLTIDIDSSSSGQSLRNAVKRFLHSKVHPILLDGRIGSGKREVGLNVWQIFLCAGIKMMAYARELDGRQKRVAKQNEESRKLMKKKKKEEGQDFGRNTNELWMCACWLEAMNYFINLVRTRFQSVERIHQTETEMQQHRTAVGGKKRRSKVNMETEHKHKEPKSHNHKREGPNHHPSHTTNAIPPPTSSQLPSPSPVSHAHFPLTSLQVHWLGIHAFSVVVARHASRYPVLTSVVRYIEKDEVIVGLGRSGTKTVGEVVAESGIQGMNTSSEMGGIEEPSKRECGKEVAASGLIATSTDYMRRLRQQALESQKAEKAKPSSTLLVAAVPSLVVPAPVVQEGSSTSAASASSHLTSSQRHQLKMMHTMKSYLIQQSQHMLHLKY